MGAAPITQPTLPPTDDLVIKEIVRLVDERNRARDAENKQAVAEVEEKLTKALTDAIAKVNSDLTVVKRRTSMPPGGFGDDGAALPLSVGAQFVQSDAFKQASWSGRFKVQQALVARLTSKAAAPAALPAIGTITEAGSGLVIYPRRVAWIEPPTFPLVMRDLLDVVPLTGTNAVEYVIENWNLAADYQVAEGDKKAQSAVAYTDATAVVRTIAHYVKISRQMLSDVPSVQQSIDRRLVYGVLLKEDKELLYGDGAAGHLKGIMTVATAYAPPTGLPTTGVTGMDMIAAAIAQVAAAGYVPNAVVLNPTDWAAMQLAKTTLGTYILAGPGYGPPQSVAPQGIWGLQVVTSINMLQGSFLVGAFPGNAALFDRESAVVEISFENEDDFIRNLATIRCEERVTLAVYVPLAFVKGNLPAPV